MKILVTGGAGFIGAYLVKNLLSRKHKVVIVDKLRNIGGLSYVNPNAEFINMDICNLKLYIKLKKYKFDVVYHLAAQSAGEPSYDNPKYDSLTNSYGTLLISNFCKENKVPKLIYTSSVAVYGNNPTTILNENSRISPDSIYGVSKYCGEMYIRQILKNTKTNYTIFRVFNTYGPGENLAFTKKGMVSIYLSYVWKKKPIEVKGSLDRFRDFTYIEDTVDALMKAANSKFSINKTYNLSSGIKTTVRELINEILYSFDLHKSYKIIKLPGTEGDSFGFHSNIQKINSELKWKPKINLREGLVKYSKWIKTIKNYKKFNLNHPFHKLAKKF